RIFLKGQITPALMLYGCNSSPLHRIVVMRCIWIIGGNTPGSNPDVADNQAANEYQQRCADIGRTRSGLSRQLPGQPDHQWEHHTRIGSNEKDKETTNTLNELYG